MPLRFDTCFFRKGPTTLLAVLALSYIALWQPVLAQVDDEISQDRPKVGVVLAGGSARGFAHIGVLKVFEEIGLPMDVITGASSGSIVAGFFAAGYTADQLEEITLSRDWNSIYKDTIERRYRPLLRRRWQEQYLVSLPLKDGQPSLPTGLIKGQQISTFLTRYALPVQDIHDFREFPIPFATVGTDLETGEAVRLETGNLARTMRAAISLPSVFTPVAIGDRIYTDGGVIRNLPAEDALALGADILVCVTLHHTLKSREELTTLAAIADQSISYNLLSSLEQQLKYCDLIIHPPLANPSLSDFSAIPQLITDGEAGTREMIPQLEALIDSVGRADYSQRKGISPTHIDSFYIADIQVEGIDEQLKKHTALAHGLQEPVVLTVDDIEEAVRDVYATELFDTVLYRLDKTDSGYILVFEVEKSNQSRIGAGFRYESKYRAAVLLSGSWGHLGGFGTSLDADLRLGNALKASVGYFKPFTYRPLFGVAVEAKAKAYPLDIFPEAEDLPIATLNTNSLEGGLLPTLTLFNVFALSAGLYAETFNTGTRVGLSELENIKDFFKQARFIWGGKVQLMGDTFDMATFPTRGHQFVLRSMFFSKSLGGERSFSHNLLDWDARWPILPNLSLISRISLGSNQGPFLDGDQASDNDVPFHYLFYAGGAFPQAFFDQRHIPLLGYRYQELVGMHLQALTLGAQMAFANDLFLLARWNTAYTSLNDWNWSPDPSEFKQGFGFTFGLRKFSMPLELTMMASKVKGPYALQLNIGHYF